MFLIWLLQTKSLQNKMNYCCPIKLRKSNKYDSNANFTAFESYFLFIKPTLIKKRWFRRCIESLGKNDIPFLFGVVEQTVEIDVVHQCYPDHSSQSREAPLSFQSLLHHHQQKIRNQRHPDLDFDGAGTLAIKIFQRKNSVSSV